MTDPNSLSQLQTISIGFQALATGILLVVLSNISFEMFGLGFGLTFIPIIALMYWPKTASRSLSIFFVFVLGILQATMSFTPLGLWAFCYLVLFVILGGEITFSNRLLPAWGSFFVCILFVATILFFIGRLLMGQWPSLVPLLTDAFASFLVFPMIFWVRNLTMEIGREPERREIS